MCLKCFFIIKMSFTCLFIFSGNALYGKTITNKEKHTNVKYATDGQTTPFTNNPLFHHMVKIDETTYEVTLHKATVKNGLPIQIRFWVYSLAKMCMLAFCYDFLANFSTNKNSNFLEWTTTRCILQSAASR